MILSLLCMALIFEILGVLAAISSANKPRETYNTAALVLAGVICVVYTVPLSWLLFTDQPRIVTVLSGALLSILGIGVVNMVRDLYGLRGPRTMLGTLANTFAGLASVAALVIIIGQVA